MIQKHIGIQVVLANLCLILFLAQVAENSHKGGSYCTWKSLKVVLDLVQHFKYYSLPSIWFLENGYHFLKWSITLKEPNIFTLL